MALQNTAEPFFMLLLRFENSFLYLIFIFFSCFGFSSDCQKLKSIESSNLIVTFSSSHSLNQDLPAFCQIKGLINPNIGFEARFPLKNWNGKFFQAGCGGFCGLIEPDRLTQSNAINHALKKGYATITTDGGHTGKHLGDADWAYNNKEAEEVYAHKILPLTYQAGHVLIQAYYNSKPNYSYFSGCSNGGRLAAKAAQEYPDLFDGIIAGCPVLNLTFNGGVFGSWLVQINTNKSGLPILNEAFASKLSMLEQNSINQCDELDGKKDGVIQMPHNCEVTLEHIPICDNKNINDCLKNDERLALINLYQGPVNSANKELFFGINPGSERYLAHWYLGSFDTKRPGTLLADGFLPNMGLPIDDDSFSAMSFNFDSGPALLQTQSDLLDALNTDLSAFAKSNGKLLMWHGLADPLVLPEQSIKYYEEVVERMGENNVQDFFKLFLIPGMGHCWEIPSVLPDQMSMLSILENWVEHDIKPNNIPIKKNNSSDTLIKEGLLRPYPKLATYN